MPARSLNPPTVCVSLRKIIGRTRNSRRSSGEGEQFGLLIVAERSDRSPEPSDLGRVLSETLSDVGVRFPFVDVDRRSTGDEQLKFRSGKDGDEITWNDGMETCDDGIDLIGDRTGQTMLSYQFDVFTFVEIGDCDVPSVRLEIDRSRLAE